MSVPDFQFFGVAPILIGKVIHYAEGTKFGGIYTYDPSELARVIGSCKSADNCAQLDQIQIELFWICHQGRRPWSLEAEQSFLALASVGYGVLTHLRAVGRTSSQTYAFIDPLDCALRLEYTAEDLERADQQGGDRWSSILAIVSRLTSLYIAVFDCWASDFPQEVKLPTSDSLRYLLETGDDNDFAVLLTALAKTNDPTVKQLLFEFSGDDEQPVRTLAQNLLKSWP